MFCNHLQNSSHLLSQKISLEGEHKKRVIWEQKQTFPFDEIIISWNAQRPQQGFFLIKVSLLVEKWTSWLSYAFWGTHEQYTFSETSFCSSVKTSQDTINVLHGKKATGFRVLVEGNHHADVKGLRALYASLVNTNEYTLVKKIEAPVSLKLEVAGISQLSLPEAYRRRVCSPSSTSAVINYLIRHFIDPLGFAEKVRDAVFNIYGNWILNIAEAANILGPAWCCCVAHLSSFDEVLNCLRNRLPVITSVQGTLPGALFPYESGHLLVVVGFDPLTREVFCMDPAYPTNELTHVAYDVKDFLKAWHRRKGLAYLFFNETLR